MTHLLKAAAACAATAIVLICGCKKTDDNKFNFKDAINNYYAMHPSCLWSDPVRFPVQVTTSDTAKTTGYDALVDQGLLQRSTAEKKVFIIATKQVTNYDLTDKGRGAWTADTTQPGFGNFCYGHPLVQSIDGSTNTGNQPGAHATVAFHSGYTGTPAWASAPETQNAFPELRANLAGPQSNSVTLLDTPTGWQVQPSNPRKPITGADGKIVE